jgi:hypothetical protein
MEVSSQILNKRVVGIYHNYIDQSLRLSLDDKTDIFFYGCAIVFDLGIIGHKVSFVSSTGTLGITFELKKMNKNPEDYKYIILSRDIKDIENKNELLVSYHQLEVKSPS